MYVPYAPAMMYRPVEKATSLDGFLSVIPCVTERPEDYVLPSGHRASTWTLYEPTPATAVCAPKATSEPI